MKLERLLVEKAEAANFHLIGPNCMGVFNPGIGLGLGSAWSEIYSGHIGLISQSGMHAITFNREAHLQGLDINKAVSFGNGTVLDSSDYLEYFGQDPEIKAIGMYIEGVRDGKRLLKVLREISARKPVVIWKGGRTIEGERASASHTRTLAISKTIWESAVRQGGAIRVSKMEELIDTLKALAYLPEVLGPGVGITGGSGGQSVVTADVFTEAGLQVPTLTRKSYDELATFFDMIGGAYQNPVDTANTNSRQMKRILEILVGDENIDNMVLIMNARSSDGMEDQINSVIDVSKSTSKPVMAILTWSFSPDGVQLAGEIIQGLQNGGVPVFISPERGALALRKALDYYIMKHGVNPR